MLRTQSLACRRGGIEIFREVDFALEAGGVLMVTGINGSGKSSLLRILAGLLPPAGGAVLWQGKNAAQDGNAYRKNLHYIGHLDAVKPELTVGEMLAYWRALQGLDGSDKMLADDPFGISALYDKPVRYLSAGQKRRLALSRLLCDDRVLWLLDEPATALDRQGQEILAACIVRHRAKGGIVIVATHHDMDFTDAAHYAMNGRDS